jgi:hypothetical protein
MSDLNEMRPFWMVHGIGCAEPRARHDSEAKALREAERLARASPGTTFVVLEATQAVRKLDVERFDFRAAPRGYRVAGDDIPF